MDKLSYLKSSRQRFNDLIRTSRNYRQPRFTDTYLTPGKKIPFKHDWGMLAHMHDLRLWTLSYAPSRINNIQRLQELHGLNNEMWYMVSNALAKRILLLLVGWVVLTRFAKGRYLNHGQKDS